LPVASAIWLKHSILDAISKRAVWPLIHSNPTAHISFNNLKRSKFPTFYSNSPELPLNKLSYFDTGCKTTGHSLRAAVRRFSTLRVRLLSFDREFRRTIQFIAAGKTG